MFNLSKDCVTLTKPTIIHGTQGEPYERIVINFSERFLLKYFSTETVKKLLSCFSLHTIPATIVKEEPRIRELFLLLHQVHSSKQENKDLTFAIYLSELLLILTSKHSILSSLQTTHLPKQVQDIIDYINNNIATLYRLDQIATHFFLSKDHISHLFKKHTGLTIMEFLTEAKISRATLFLRTTSKSIADISQICAFDTPAYFCIVFKKRMGITPLQYRKQFQEKTF